MFSGIDYSQLIAGTMSPEEVRQAVLPRVFEMVLMTGGLGHLSATLEYPDGTIEIQLDSFIKWPPVCKSTIFVREGRVFTDKTIGSLPEGEGEDILLCSNSKRDSGCHKGCGCDCLLGRGYMDWEREDEVPHKKCD